MCLHLGALLPDLLHRFWNFSTVLPKIRALQGLVPKASLTAAEEAVAWSNIKAWNTAHSYRVVMFVSSLAMGLASFCGAPRSS